MLSGPNIIGNVSEAMVSGYLASQGWEVFNASQSHSRADLIYIRDGASKRVQVKTATWTKKPETGHQYEQCVLKRTHSSAYTADELDEFWIVGTHLWCFPFESLNGLTMISLGTTNLRSRKTIREYDPNDYIVVHGDLAFPYRDRLFKNSPSPFSTITNTKYTPDSFRKLKYKVKD